VCNDTSGRHLQPSDGRTRQADCRNLAAFGLSVSTGALEVALFRRRSAAIRPTTDRDAHRGDLDHLAAFARARHGVEAYIEPRTTVTSTTVILIAHDGEWTRRRVTNPEQARRWAHGLNIPVYDVALMGYPKRMRDYNARMKADRGGPETATSV
jgi:hypothetical protein